MNKLLLWVAALACGCASAPATPPVAASSFGGLEAVSGARSAVAQPSPPQHEAEEFHRNEIAFAIGEFNEAEESGVRLGIDYERRAPGGWNEFFDERWGVGAMIDFDRPPVDSVLVAAQFVYHPSSGAAFVFAPGYLSVDGTGEDSWVMRLGSRYSFPIAPHFTLTPEMFYDILEGGNRKGVLAIALGVGF